jgi:hypothetical protein
MNTSPAGGPSVIELSDIPPGYLALDMDAAQTCQGLPWDVLAGTGEVDSDHGDCWVTAIPVTRCD